MKKVSEEVPISELLLEIPKIYSCKETLFQTIGYWQIINHVQMLLSVNGKFNLFCFSELSFDAYKLAQFGPQYYSVFSCVVSNSDCHKESALGRDGKSHGYGRKKEMRHRNSM